MSSHKGTRPAEEVTRSLLYAQRLGGNNPKWRAVSENGSAYVVKWSKNNDGLVPEINEREALTSVLGRLVGVAVVDAWVIESNLLPDPGLPPDDASAPLIRGRCVVMPFLEGGTVALNKSESALLVQEDPSAVADLLAFMHWIGDEDRGLEDVMLAGGRLTLIDNGLCGPGRPESTLRGYHPHWPCYSPEAKVKKCYGGKGESLVEFVLRDAMLPHEVVAVPPVVGRIDQVSDQALRTVVSYCRLDSRVADVLIDRRATLAADYADWLSKACALFGNPLSR